MNNDVLLAIVHSVIILAIVSISDSIHAQTEPCFNGRVLQEASLSTGTKISWTVPSDKIATSVSRSFVADSESNQSIAIQTEIFRQGVVYPIERFGTQFSTSNVSRAISDVPIHLEGGDTIQMTITNAGFGSGTFSLSLTACPNPFL